MKIFVIGLDCAAPEIVFGNERFENLHSLMRDGCYGRLESVIPPITVPAWMCMATSQDPGSLGLYGFRNRTDYSYKGLGIADSGSIAVPAIWDHVGSQGGRVVTIGIPPAFPPRKVEGVSVGCFLTPDTGTSDYTYPRSIKSELEALVGNYPVDVRGFRTDDKEWLLKQIYEMTRKHFEVVRYLMTVVEWDYFQFVEIGVDRIHHGFWKFHDPAHRQHVKGNPHETAILDYYSFVDQEIGKTLGLLDEDTTVLVLSDHGAKSLDGGFCINEWLYQEGLLALREYPEKPKPFSELEVDWENTKVWSEGGYYARIFVNVRGREPQGIVPVEEYEVLLEDLIRRLEAVPDDRGNTMRTQVFKPRDIYREVRNIPPDLIVHLDGLSWRSIGSVGHGTLYLQENDTGPDDCNHAQFGMFILKAETLPLKGEVQGAHLLDMAPTLLDLAGMPIPENMQGRSLLTRQEP